MGRVLYMGLPDIEKMLGFVRFFFVGILHDIGKMFSFVKLRHGRALYTEIIQFSEVLRGGELHSCCTERLRPRKCPCKPLGARMDIPTPD